MPSDFVGPRSDLLITSTSTPEYIRDYTDTRSMVNLGRSVFGALGHPEWIDKLAAIGTVGVASTPERLAQVMRDASICGLGQAAPLALEAAIAVPDMPAKIIEPTTLTWPRPPFSQPTSASAKL